MTSKSLGGSLSGAEWLLLGETKLAELFEKKNVAATKASGARRQAKRDSR